MNLLNRIYAWFNPETFVCGNRETGFGTWKYNEIPDPNYVYIIKAQEGYLYDGGCAGDIYDKELTWDITTFKTRQSARNYHLTGKVVRIKKSDIPTRKI